MNVYTALNTDDYLIVEVNGEYHKAILNKNVKDTDVVFEFKSINHTMSNTFEINPNNATQLIYESDIYKVTSKVVLNDELGRYIDILAESITFDSETKIPLSKEDLRKIDWYGKNNDKRECWIYTDIYEINGIDINEAVAVKVNNNYYFAKKI